MANCSHAQAAPLMIFAKATSALKPLFGAPFGPSKAIFSAFLLVAAAFWSVTEPCYRGPRYFEVAYAAVVLTTAFWTSVSTDQAITGWRRAASVVLRIGGSLISFAILLALTLFVCSLFTPTYQCYTERTRTSELILQAEQYKSPVEENIRRHQTVERANEGVIFQPKGHVLAGGILFDGTIVVLGENPTALVAWKPSLKDGAVLWECSGFPQNVLPSICNGLPRF